MNNKNFILSLFLLSTIPVFAQEADMSLIPYRQGDLWGYSTPEKNVEIKPQYEEADLFYEGYASVKKGGKYGYINKAGKVVIPFRYFTAKHFRFGYFESAGKKNAAGENNTNQKTVLFAGASLVATGYEICIDTKGNRMPKCPAIPENSAKNINKPNTETIVSNYSTMIKSELYDKIVGDYKMPGAEDSYYIATRNDKFGVFNKTFEIIVPFEYSNIVKVKMGIMPYLVVEKDSLKGMVFGNGSLYMPVENSRLDYIAGSDGKNYLIFTKDGKSGVKNSRYEIIVKPTYTDIAYSEDGGFVLTGDANLKGFCFFNRNIIEPLYSEVVPVKGGDFVKVKTYAGKWGYINSYLVEFFEE